ncbi:MAG: MFS transporter, partial [bacterium]
RVAATRPTRPNVPDGVVVVDPHSSRPLIASSSPWSALRLPAFRAIWLASLVSNIGTWMQSASAAWMMTSLSTSPVLVALMQTASSLPFFLLALPSGALADIVDRRRVLLATQAWMAAAAAVLGVLTLRGMVDAWSLLGLTFLLGVGAALSAPAFQALIPELVPRADLSSAVALGSVSMNVARAVGPALGGLLLAAHATGLVFLLNAASFLAVIVVVLTIRATVRESTLPPERVIGAMIAGARFVRHSPPLRGVLAHSAAFTLTGSALWALLPVVARRDLGLGGVGYGLLLTCLGGGAIAGAWLLPILRRRVGSDRVLIGATLGFAAASAALGLAHNLPVIAVAMVGAGVAWMAGMSTLNVAAQQAAPAWVRARALAVSLLVIQGGLAVGSLAAGALAERLGTPRALSVFAVAMVIGGVLTVRRRLHGLDDLDLTPSEPRPAPVLPADLDPEEVPVLVTVEYDIAPADAAAFVVAASALERIRRRDGAIEWGLYRDAERASRFVETFYVPSWLEHLRQHERITVADRLVEGQVRAFQRGEAPIITHLLGTRP